MPPAGFEPIIPEIEQSQSHNVDGAAAVCLVSYSINNINISSMNTKKQCYEIHKGEMMAGACGYGNEVSGSIKCGEFLD